MITLPGGGTLFRFRCYFIAFEDITLVRQGLSANFDIVEQVATDDMKHASGFHHAIFLMKCPAKAFCAILYSYFNFLDLCEVCLYAFWNEFRPFVTKYSMLGAN